ncbi:MAG: sigma-54 dependent transcriptional regulator, partial [Verrucomicrobiales bacterium]
MAKILIIDDEAAILNLMSQLCRRLGHQVEAYQTGREGMAALEREVPELLIVDLRIGDMDGMQIIKRCKADYPSMNIIMVTGYGSVEVAVEAMRHGAFDYLAKPFELDDLQRTINRALAVQSGGASDASFPMDETLTSETKLIGESTQMRDILKLVDKIKDSDSPVLLEGEFGSGKQMVARAIHNASRRNPAPFKMLQCSSLPEDLLEQELFGTGGSHTIFNRAQGGTVLLEEVDLLPQRLQSQLDHFLEDVNGRRLRGTLPSNLDFRFIATSCDRLEECVKKGSFRQDFYYRISVIPIHIPPLRKRKEDIPPLVDHFLSNHAKLTETS